MTLFVNENDKYISGVKMTDFDTISTAKKIVAIFIYVMLILTY